MLTRLKKSSQILALIWNHINLPDLEIHGGSYWLQIKNG